MNASKAREYFNEAISKATDPNQISRIELAREYFCNPSFRSALEAETFRINNMKISAHR